jgi:hypothetical protein
MGKWRESFKSLFGKSASQQDYKHYANALRKLVQKNNLPGLRLTRERSSTGKEMLVMERTEKRVATQEKEDKQIALIELSPLEEAWENVLDTLRHQLGEATVNSWLQPLQVMSFEEGVLTFRTSLKFTAERVDSLYRSRLLSAWKTVGYEVATLRIDTPHTRSAA